MIRGAEKETARRGFTLFEAMAALALMGILLGALGAITGQWLPAWRYGFGRLQRLETLDVGLERLTQDLAAARWVTAGGAQQPPLFFGEPTAITLVRSAIGPNAGPRLEWVRVQEIAGGAGPILTRTRAPYAPIAEGGAPAAFSDPVALIRAPWRVRFSFAGVDGSWRETWIGERRLPRAVRIDILGKDGEAPALTTVAALHVDAPAACVDKVSIENCLIDLSRGTQ